jgi:hypothetical protein
MGSTGCGEMDLHRDFRRHIGFQFEPPEPVSTRVETDRAAPEAYVRAGLASVPLEQPGPPVRATLNLPCASQTRVAGTRLSKRIK